MIQRQQKNTPKMNSEQKNSMNLWAQSIFIYIHVQFEAPMAAFGKDQCKNIKYIQYSCISRGFLLNLLAKLFSKGVEKDKNR